METFTEALAALLGRLGRIDGPLVALLSRLLVIVIAVVAAWSAYRALGRLIDRLLRPLEGAADYPAKVQRARTLAPLLKNAALYGVWFLAVVVILREIGVDVRALLVSAGVLGLALGLGAQSLIKDVITGFFLLFEGLIAVGDVIEVGPHTGTVESIGLRVTKLRLLNGALRVVPNGELTQFGNHHRGWARAVVEVSISTRVRVADAFAALERVAEAWARETGLALEPPLTQGLIRLGDGDMGLRVMVKVEPARRLEAEMQLRRRIKEAFERGEILPAGGAPPAPGEPRLPAPGAAAAPGEPPPVPGLPGLTAGEQESER
jgi:small conductance mechanosensitive channel